MYKNRTNPLNMTGINTTQHTNRYHKLDRHTCIAICYLLQGVVKHVFYYALVTVDGLEPVDFSTEYGW